MEGVTDFTEKLRDLLEKYRDYLDRTELPKLKDQYKAFHSAYKAIYTVLLKKGQVHEDPYKHDTKISEISVPPDHNFLDSEKDNQMGIRLSTFESQIDFLLSYYQFSTEFLDLSRIKLLVGLLRYIAWDQFSEISSKSTTRALAEYVGKIKKGEDVFSTNILKDSVDQMQKSSKSALLILKALAAYHKESYKLEVRLGLLSRLDLNPAAVLPQKEETLQMIKKRFSKDLPGKHFYPELITEILTEDYGADSILLKQKVLESLKIPEVKEKKLIQKVPLSAMLMDAVRATATVSRYLDEAAGKLSDNSFLLQNQELPFFERLRRWIRKLVQKDEEPLSYEVEYDDITTSSTQRERIPFLSFIEELKKRARLYNGLLQKSGPASRKLETAGEDQLFAFLDKNLEDLRLIYRRLNALDTFFKSEIPREDRGSIRGIKIELTAIKNNMLKANQKRHDYAAKKEEAEQLAKLGVDPNAQ